MVGTEEIRPERSSAKSAGGEKFNEFMNFTNLSGNAELAAEHNAEFRLIADDIEEVYM